MPHIKEEEMSMSATLRTFILLGLLSSAAVSIAACSHTVEGAGDDIQKMGNEVEDATD
jgi:predicted small secreted protein